MKTLFKYTLSAIALCALAACSDEATGPSDMANPDAGKELIALVGAPNFGVTRAASDPTGFTSKTKVVMRIKAEEDGGTGVRYTQSVAVAGPEVSSDDHTSILSTVTEYTGGKHSDLSYETWPCQKRYWDDAFGRESKLTVYAVAVPDKNTEDDDLSHVTDGKVSSTILDQAGTTVDLNPQWYTISGSETTVVAWDVNAAQTGETMAAKDLAYSNNIRYGETKYKGRYHYTWNGSAWNTSMELGPLSWQEKTSGSTTGKFDIGHLVFKHALTKITLNLQEGAGFDHSVNTDFKWTNGGSEVTQNITLTGFYTNGKLDVSTGSWSDAVANNITSMYETTPSTPDVQTTRSVHAFILPGTTLDNVSDNVITFEIDNAIYHVTGDQIYEAIKLAESTFTTPEAGKHYEINMTVNKKAVESFTAAVVPWEKVTASSSTTNARIAISLLNNGAAKSGTADFDLYRAADINKGDIDDDYVSYEWKTGYTGNKATKLSEVGTGTYQATKWYWPDNKTFYHFRTVSPTGLAVTTDAGGDYIPLTYGTEVSWGAPFYCKDGDTSKPRTTSATLKYSTTNGFDGDGDKTQIYKAIGPTTGIINLEMFYMMSDVTIKLTTNDGGADAVTLADATVSFSNIYTDGKVLMGNGKVVPVTRSASPVGGTVSKIDATTAYSWQHLFIPQSLAETDNNVELTITTADHNQYKVTMKDVLATTVTNNLIYNQYKPSGEKYIINQWYPSYQYAYTFTLTKTGISSITATLANWEKVTASDNVQIQ